MRLKRLTKKKKTESKGDKKEGVETEHLKEY